MNDDDKIEIDWDLYFTNKNQDNQMTKITSKKIIDKEFLLESDYHDLKKEKKKYEITTPNTNG